MIRSAYYICSHHLERQNAIEDSPSEMAGLAAVVASGVGDSAAGGGASFATGRARTFHSFVLARTEMQTTFACKQRLLSLNYTKNLSLVDKMSSRCSVIVIALWLLRFLLFCWHLLVILVCAERMIQRLLIVTRRSTYAIFPLI